MAIPINSVLRIDILGSLFNQQIVTTFAYRTTNTSSNPSIIDDCTNIAGDFKAGAVTPFLAFLACCSPQYNADRVRCQMIYPQRWRPGYNDVNLPGTNANATNSTNQSAVITRGSATATRNSIGSIHIPGLSGLNILDGNVTAAFLTLMSTVGSRMLNIWTVPSNGLNLVPVLVNPYRPPTVDPPSPGQVFDTQDLYFTTPQRTARVMRRRTIGVGK